MGRKRLYETTDDKKQAQHEYYDKTKDEYKRFYQLASKKYMMNKQLKKCEEKLNVLHVNMEDSKAIQLQTQMKIDKLKARIAKYKERLPIVIEQLEIERKKKWNSDYHTKAVLSTFEKFSPKFLSERILPLVKFDRIDSYYSGSL